MGEDLTERRLRFALDAGTTATAFWAAVRDDAGTLVDLVLVNCSTGFADWLARPLEGLVGRRYSELIPTGLHERLPVYLRALRDRRPTTLMFDRVSPHGGISVAEVRCAPMGEDELHVALWDVTEREERLRRVERARREALESRELLATALNASPDGYAVYRLEAPLGEGRADLVVEFLNEVAAAPSGRSPDEWRGALLGEWFPEAESSGLETVLRQVLADKVARRVVITTQSITGLVGRFENVVTPFGPDRLVVEWWAADADTPEGIDAPAAMPTGTRLDPLTGLHNRGEFRRQLEDRLARTAPGESAGAVIVVDVDNFGRLNDLVGPRRADAALVAFARALRSLEPFLVLAARIGADACAALIPGAVSTGETDLARVHANRVVREVADALGLPPMTVSGGLRVIEPGMTVDDILRDCDTALRHSIREGGVQLTVFTPEVRADLLADYLAAEDIRTGVAAGQFRVAYQPVVRADTGHHIGDEALARWLHPVHGTLMPGRFIPIAESTGTIVALGEWILDEVVAECAAQAHDRTVGVNVSGVQLLQSDVPALVARVLERHRLSADRLVVEITESAILPESLRIRESMAELRQLGVQIAIDDFGSGYSSIGYLDWLPVDVVKLDQRFLAGDLDRRRRNLVAATAQLVRSIGARTLAEGIETQEQWDVVQEAGINFGQGFLFGHAVVPLRLQRDRAQRPGMTG